MAACRAKPGWRSRRNSSPVHYPVVVATASLELGIDIGHVDVVCHIGSPRNLAVLLQRVGRSGHWLGAIPKGLFYPLTRDDLMQSVAAIRAVRQGELDKLNLIRKAAGYPGAADGRDGGELRSWPRKERRRHENSPPHPPRMAGEERGGRH